MNGMFYAPIRREAIENPMRDVAYALIPERVASADLDDVGEPIDINIGDGTGYTTTWRKTALRCRVIWTYGAKVNSYGGGLIFSDKMGDLMLQGKIADKPVYDAVYGNENAYILVNNGAGEYVRVRPVSIAANRVHELTSLEVDCKVVSAADNE